jgi:hypothetical protein
LGNATLTLTIADDSHNHTIANVDGLQSALDSKLNSSSYTAADVLTKIKTVDGASSGLDADLLDGQQGSYYLNWTNITNKPDPSLTINGDASGLATFTDLGNATLTLTIADDSHNHTIANVDGLQSALDSKAEEAVTISAGAGLTGGGNLTQNRTISHADTSSQASVNNSNGTVIQDITLDTYGHITSLGSANLDDRYYTETEVDNTFAPLADPNFTGAVDIANRLTIGSTERAAVNGFEISGGTSSMIMTVQDGSGRIQWRWNASSGTAPTYLVSGEQSARYEILDVTQPGDALWRVDHADAGTAGETISYTNILSLGTTTFSYNSNTVWHAGNDGSGSGLDADLLDGQNGSYYLDWTNTTNKPDPVVTVSLSGDVSGSGQTTLTDLANGTISITTSVQPNSVSLGTDTTGNYVSTVSGTTNQVLVSGSGSESAAVTLSLPQNIHTGASPSFAGLTVSGTATAADFNSTSDRALKRDFSKIDSALSKVQKISGYTFTYKATDKRSVGVIAQEIEQILPEAVSGEEGTKTVAYGNLVALLIEAVKEQQQQIERLQNGR